MAQEPIVVTCDGCGNRIEQDQKHIALMMYEVDNGNGITTQARQNDYHEDCVPVEAAEELEFEVGDLEVIPASEPGPEPETPGESA